MEDEDRGRGGDWIWPGEPTTSNNAIMVTKKVPCRHPRVQPIILVVLMVECLAVLPIQRHAATKPKLFQSTEQCNSGVVYMISGTHSKKQKSAGCTGNNVVPVPGLWWRPCYSRITI